MADVFHGISLTFLITVVLCQPNHEFENDRRERLSHGWFDVPLSKIRSRDLNTSTFMIARDQFAQQSGSSFAEEKSRYEAYFMWLRNLSTELVCQLEGFAVAVAVMVIWGILDNDMEWCCLVLLGAMYAGATVLSIDQLYCKGAPRTFPFWLWISDSSSMLKLKLKLNQFN